MAHKITITKLMDGPKNGVFHIFIESDGVSPDLIDYVLIDPAESFSPSFPNKPLITVESISYDLTGFDSYLDFDYLISDTKLWSMSGGQSAMVDFGYLGGLKDRSNALDGTGKLQLTTSGLTAGKFGSIIIRVKKS